MYNGKHQIVIVIVLDILFANNSNMRRSSQGYIVLLFGGAVIWKIMRQSIITISLIKIELFVFEFIIKEIIMFKKLFRDLILILNNL
jgi:hypothetical protein